jgi:hypothetical protein
MADEQKDSLMNNTDMSPEMVEALERFQSIPYPTHAALKAKYGHLLAQWAKDWPSPRHAGQPAPKSTLVWEFWNNIKLSVEAHMAEITSTSTDAVAAAFGARQPAIAGLRVRSLRRLEASEVPSGAGADRRRSCVIRDVASNCSGYVTCEAQESGKLKFTFKLKKDRPIVPFYLTVNDGRGNRLLSRKEINAETYEVKDISPGDYFIKLQSKTNSENVEFTIKAESSNATR